MKRIAETIINSISANARCADLVDRCLNISPRRAMAIRVCIVNAVLLPAAGTPDNSNRTGAGSRAARSYKLTLTCHLSKPP